MAVVVSVSLGSSDKKLSCKEGEAACGGKEGWEGEGGSELVVGVLVLERLPVIPPGNGEKPLLDGGRGGGINVLASLPKHMVSGSTSDAIEKSLPTSA